MIEIHGAPFDLGGARQGSRLGPDALRLAGIVPSLAQVTSLKIHDRGNLQTDLNAQPGEGIPYIQPAGDAILELKKTTREILENGNFPIMLGGEHSMSAGPLAAMVERYGDQLGVLWIDAHGDMNTPGISPSMNIHGMPLALLCGQPSGESGEIDSDWNDLQSRLVTKPLNVKNICWFGLRDVDGEERDRVKEGFPITMQHIDRDGVEGCWKKIHATLLNRKIRHLYISLDVDAMDPILAPGTGTAVRGGLTYREAHFLAELIHETLTTEKSYDLVGLDVVEVSPIHDYNNQTATIAAEWVASLFGKTILG